MKIAVAGALGRMGRRFVHLAAASDGAIQLTGATVRPGSEAIGRPISELIFGAPGEVLLTDDPAHAGSGADVWIDFTPPEACVAALDALSESGHPVSAAVVGGTGYSAENMERLCGHSARLALVVSGNFSLGVAILCRAVRQVARALPETNWDIDVLDVHHRHKRDTPSGTAVMLAEAAASGCGGSQRPTISMVFPDGPRAGGTIAVTSVRAGETVGKHSVLFSGESETITLEHQALTRDVFAHGALTAARWAVDAPSGLYDMTDVLEG